MAGFDRAKAVEILQKLDKGEMSRDDLIAANKLLDEDQSGHDPTVGEMLGVAAQHAMENGSQIARSVMEGHTAGLSEPVASGMAASMTTGKVPTAASEVPNNRERGFNPPEVKEAFDKNVDERRAWKAENPGSDTASQFAGAVMPGPANVGQAVFGVASKMVGELPKGAGVVQRAAKGLAEGGTGTAAFEGVREAALRPTGLLKDGEANVADSTTYGAAAGAAAPFVGHVFGRAGKAMSPLARRAFSVVFGVNEHAVKEGLAKPDRLEARIPISDIKQKVDEFVGSMKAAVDAGKVKSDEAKEALNQFERDTRATIEREHAGARENLREARKELQSAFQNRVRELMDTPKPIELTYDVAGGMEDLKKQAMEASAAGYEALGRAKGKISIAQIPQVIKGAIEQLQIDKKGALGQAAMEAERKLMGYYERMKAYGASVPLPEAKKMLIQLDNDVEWAQEVAGFNSALDGGLKQVRHAIDERLKLAVPDYAKAMDNAAPIFKTLEEAKPYYGKLDRIRNTLVSIDRLAGDGSRESLIEIGKRTKRDFETPLENYMASRDALNDRQNLRMGLKPELEAIKGAEEKLKPFNPQDKAVRRQQEIAGSREVRTYEMAQQQLAKAKAAYDPYSTIGPASSQAKIEALMRSSADDPDGAQQHLRKLFLQLSELPGAPKQSITGGKELTLHDAIEYMRLNSAFERESTNGSRRVNLFMGLGGALVGGLKGDVTTGAVVGGGLGYYLDKYGPTTARDIILWYSRVRGMPTVQKIADARLPDIVKKEMMRDLQEFIAIANTDIRQPIRVPIDQRAQTRIDIDKSGMSNIEKARNLTSLNENGYLVDAARLVTGKQPEELEQLAQIEKAKASQRERDEYGPQPLQGPPEPPMELAEPATEAEADELRTKNRGAVADLARSKVRAAAPITQLPTKTLKEKALERAMGR